MIERTIPLPRLLNADLSLNREIRPISVSVDLSITPLSYASMELPTGEELPARSYVEMFTPFGSAGVFRVRSPQTAYGQTSTTAELEHAIVEVGDYVVTTDYDDMMAASTAMQTIFGFYRGSKWQLGDVSALGSGQIALESKHNRVLETMLAIMEQRPNCMMTFDFSTTPWTVAVAQRGTTVEAEGRLSRNVTNAKVIYDDTELCTRVYYSIPSTDASGQPSTTWTSLDADTISTYGIVERDVSTGSKYTASEALAVATEYLNKHKRPRISVQINAVELSRITGLAWDTFSIGKMFRLALPDYDVTISKDITAISFPDVYGNPMDIRVSLAEEEDTAIKFLHDVDAKGGSGGGGGAKKKTEDTFKEYRTNFERDGYHIELNAQHWDETDGLLQQAGMYLDSQGVLIYADDDVNMIGAKFNVTNNAISSEVTRASAAEGNLSSRITQTETNITLKVSKGDVATQLAVECGNVTVSGGNLKVDGYIETNELITEIAKAAQVTVQELVAGTVESTYGVSGATVTGDTVNATTALNVVGTGAVWHSLSNGTDTVQFLGTGDITFDRAAARAEGAAAVVVDLSDGGWIINDANTGDYTRVITPTKDGVAVSSKAITISGQTVWSLGKAKGVQEANAAVTLSGSWSGAKYTVTNSANSRKQEITITTDSGSWSLDGQYNRTITVKEGNTTVTTVPISAKSVYDVGVIAGENEFTATTVQILGSSVSVTPIGTSHTVTPIGTSHTITPVGTYRSGYKRGTSHTDALTGYTTFNNGNAIQLFSYSDGSYHPEGRAVWRKNGTVSTLYESGGQYGLYEGGDPVTYYEKGTAVTYYEAGTAATYYTDGGSQTYYTKQTPST